MLGLNLSLGLASNSNGRNAVSRMVATLRRLGGSLWMVDNAFSGSYIDNVGTTPVTAYGDLLGLTTDWLGVLGPELAGLSSAWQSYGTGISLSGGQMVFSATPAGQCSMRGTPLAANKTYALEITVPSIAGGALSMFLGGGAGITNITTPGTYRGVYKATSIDGPYLWVSSGTVTAVVTVASCKEITGNHATQSAVASKPSVQRIGSATAISFDGSNDFLQTSITTGNEGFVAAGVTFSGAVSAIETAAWSGANAPTIKGVWLARVGAVSENTLWLATGNGSTRNIAAKTDVALRNMPRVIEGGWSASTIFVGVDGAITPATPSGDLTPPASSLQIGAATGPSFFNGPMHAIAYAPVLPNAADRATIRNGIAALQGRTL